MTRITEAKYEILAALNTLQFRLEKKTGMTEPEFTKLVLAVMEERARAYILSQDNVQVITTTEQEKTDDL